MIVVVGVGNRLRKDDAIGVRVVEALMKRIRRNDVRFFIGETIPVNLVGEIRKLKPDRVFVVDAVDFSGEVGEVRLLDNVESVSSTHKMSFDAFSKLVGREVKIIGIQPENVGFGEELSVALSGRMDRIVDDVSRLIFSRFS